MIVNFAVSLLCYSKCNTVETHADARLCGDIPLNRMRYIPVASQNLIFAMIYNVCRLINIEVICKI